MSLPLQGPPHAFANSSSTSPAPADEMKYHPLFSMPDADVILCSQDEVLFRVYSQTLRTASSWFGAMLDLPQHSTAAIAQDIIRLSEDAAVLSALLKMACCMGPLSLDSVDFVEAVLCAAEKYDMPGAISTIRGLIVSPFMKGSPLRLYGIATRRHWVEEAKLFSARTHSLDLNAPNSSVEIRRMDSDALVALMSLHRRRRDAFKEALNDTGLFSASRSRSSVCPHCSHVITHDAWYALKEGWISKLESEPIADPASALMESQRAQVEAVLLAACGGCNRPLYSAMGTMDNLRHAIENLPQSVEPAILYVFGLSVWSAVPELAVEELEYPPDAVQKKIVNLVEGANFTPEFLQIVSTAPVDVHSPKATLPALQAGGQVFTDTESVTRYLVQNAPKKVTPGTGFIAKLHEDKYDPNFPLLLTRNEEELKAASLGFPLTFVQNRQNALEKHSKTPQAAPFKQFYDEKITGNGGVLAIYRGEAPEDAKTAFFQQSTAHWEAISAFITNELPSLLPESGFLGGASPGEDDFHLAAWLARLAHVNGGTVGRDGYKALEKETKQPLPPKVAAYWAAWSERPSWKKVYVEGLH
ncbi:hypothetical protein WOLCODRAFT_160179 [Wolfiporia cocos MD-104 SS10]|uniref:Uncharacterized protein n=1 Tax=Wolfiporia cocos (strain MD-104) TaxID=742152 RepID=A0A2H3IUB7_WOLCO|nr:hypothetical protein WOLCODRAFT_160179 [Wolfiporia cocos MD-104 SS10]